MLSLEHELPVSSNRTRLEILASMLKVAHNGSLKTHIMYKANLSHRQLEKYLTFLMSNELLEKVSDLEHISGQYRVTEKGTEFLKDYSSLYAHLKTSLVNP